MELNFLSFYVSIHKCKGQESDVDKAVDGILDSSRDINVGDISDFGKFSYYYSVRVFNITDNKVCLKYLIWNTGKSLHHTNKYSRLHQINIKKPLTRKEIDF